ncbi:MAG: hypothetical protein KAH84_07285 [Thiomargarita sp.]|nr:hypothetical protein [Thiomargarita sp.]
MSEISEKELEALEAIRKLISQGEIKENNEDRDNFNKEFPKLQEKVDTFLQVSQEEFKPKDVVRWKKGLKNKKYPKESQFAVVIEQLKEIIIPSNSESGTPYFREPLDIILGILDQDGDLMLYHYDRRRFEIVSDKEIAQMKV